MVVVLSDFVNFSGELENALGGGGFAGVDVGEDADITVFAEVCHGNCLEKGGT